MAGTRNHGETDRCAVRRMTEQIPPSVTATVRIERAPLEIVQAAYRKEPEQMSVVLGRAVLGPRGELLGVGGPFQRVATSTGPFEPTVDVILIRIDSAGARWRLL